jgi:hypothetical protein
MPFRLTAFWFTLRAYCPSAQPFPFTRPRKLNDATGYEQVVIRRGWLIYVSPRSKTVRPGISGSRVEFFVETTSGSS